MNVQSAVQQQLSFWHQILDQVLADCGDDQLNANLPSATISSIASIYAHIAFVEDSVIQGMLERKPLLLEAHNAASAVSVDFPGMPPAMRLDWGRNVRMNLPSFQAYATSVFAATEAYLGRARDADLARKITGPFGEQTVEWVLVNVLGTHAPQHVGEIAALKGVLGMRGLPF